MVSLGSKSTDYSGHCRAIKVHISNVTDLTAGSVWYQRMEYTELWRYLAEIPCFWHLIITLHLHKKILGIITGNTPEP